MQDQWKLQKYKILPRLRDLGIVGQLPGFQGNVPIQLKTIYGDSNITQQGATGWMDSLDPLFEEIAKLWMETLIEDFGTMHWYQLDGYFNGGTAPWINGDINDRGNTMISRSSLRGLQQISRDDTWYRRGVAAYRSLSDTDPDAIWAFQGFSFVDWSSSEQAGYLKGFIDSAPQGRFVIIDMSYGADGEWKKWDEASFFGASFIWTTLHDFGGTDGIKGNVSQLTRIPFEAVDKSASIVGSGGTPEGLDQNPLYYEFLFEQPFRATPVSNITETFIRRSHQRYRMKERDDNISKAWDLLMDSLYATDRSVQDLTGVAHLKPRDGVSLFESDGYTPTEMMCKVAGAWKHLLTAARTHGLEFINEPFRYDLVNLGREVLAQLSTPAALNFTKSTEEYPIEKDELLSSGQFYISLLNDLDELVATDDAFLLGPWLESARRWGVDSSDCYSSHYTYMATDCSCECFYEWNARTQITTWNPTNAANQKIPSGPIDYAAKHWNGLIKDYYSKRASLLLAQAIEDQSRGHALNHTEVDRLFALHAYSWTRATNKYATEPVGDTLQLSLTMWEKYKGWFTTCKDPLVQTN